MSMSGQRHSSSKGRRSDFNDWKTKSNTHTGLPFPNFGSGKHEIPAVCRCIYDGKNFYVTNYRDMHTLNHNGSFGTSSLTFRGLSYGETTFTQRAYFQKKWVNDLTSDNHVNGSVKLDANSSLSCFKASNGKRVRIDVEPSKTGSKLLVHVSTEATNCSSDSDLTNTSKISNSRVKLVNNNNSEMGEDHEMDLSDQACKGSNDSESEEKSPLLDTDKQKCAPKIDTHVLEEEKLILMPEEAIFLSFGVGCLAIYNLQGQTVDYRQCWRNIVTLDSDFPTQYAAYHYFRGKNWVPKSGDIYGASYVLYEAGPEINHSAYIVHILESRKPKPTWMELAAWQRLATHVSKQVLLCEVSVPETFRPEISEPRSVFEMKLKEMSVMRWAPNGFQSS